jgi:hypothetical protein
MSQAAGHAIMTDPSETLIQDLQNLARHLEAQGPDLSRWPLQTQQRFAGLLASNQAAQSMLREARALEAVVERGLVASIESGPLLQLQADRLARLRTTVLQAAAAEGAPRAVLQAPMEISQTADGAELEWPAARTAEQAQTTSQIVERSVEQVARLRPRPMQRSFFGLPAMAAMAASLVLGLFLGARGLDGQVFAPAAQPDNATLTDEDDLDDAEMAFGAGFGDVDEENTL